MNKKFIHETGLDRIGRVGETLCGVVIEAVLAQCAHALHSFNDCTVAATAINLLVSSSTEVHLSQLVVFFLLSLLMYTSHVSHFPGCSNIAFVTEYSSTSINELPQSSLESCAFTGYICMPTLVRMCTCMRARDNWDVFCGLMYVDTS